MCRPAEVQRRLGNSRLYIIDTGASLDVSNSKKAKKPLLKFIRRKATVVEMGTANGTADPDTGIRMSIAAWDIQTDHTLMSSPELLSVGERCWESG